MATTIANLLIKLEAETSGVQKGFANVQKAAIALGAAITAASVKGLELFDQQDKAEKSLLTALKGRETVQKRLIQQASALQGVTLFGDEATIQAQSFLAQMNLSEEAIKRLTPLVQDFATAQGTGLNEAAKLVAKSVGSSTNALSRYGIAIEGAVGTNERLNSAVTALTQSFGGQAEAAALAGTGGIKQMENALGDVLEIVGEALAPAVNEAAGLVKEWATDLTQYSETGGFKKVQAALLAGVEAVRVYAESFRLAIGPAVGLVNAVEAGALALKGKFSQAAEKGKKAIQEFGKQFQLIGNIGENIDRVTNAYSDALNRLTTEAAGEGGKGGAAGAMQKLAEVQEEVITRVKLTNKELKDQIALLSQYNPAAAAQQVATIPTTGVSGSGTGDPRGISIASVADTEAVEAMREQIYSLAGSYGILNETLVSYIEGLETTTTLTEALVTLNSNWYQGILEVGNALEQYSSQGGASLKEFANVALQASRKVVGGFIREGIAALIKNAFVNSGNPLIGLALAPVAAGLGETLFNSILKGLKIPAFGDGGLVTGPTLALVGEKGPELITPLNKLQNGPLEVRVVGEIEGNKLKLLMDRQNAIGRRKFG